MPGYQHFHLPPSYRAVAALGARGLAWEWLRRNAAFRALWAAAPPPARRANAAVLRTLARSRRPLVDIARSPLAPEWAAWGITFAVSPEVPASDSLAAAPPIGWAPQIDAAQLTVVRPVPWARAIDDIGFDPERWGERVFRVRAPGGDQWLIRRSGAPELALWVPQGLAPPRGGAFGLYLHAHHGLAERCHAADRFRRAIGLGRPLRARPFAQARRHAIMLYLFDARLLGVSLRASADILLDRAPPDWRTSSVRSDLRRLAETADHLAAGGYRNLLR